MEGQSLPWSVEHRYLAEAMQVGLRDVLMRQNEILSEGAAQIGRAPKDLE